jgi:hypothetical protein
MIFGSLSAEERSSLWREHLNNAANDNTFSDKQRSLILQVLAQVDSTVYETPNAVKDRMGAFLGSIENEFTDEQFREVFLLLGPTEGSLSHPSAAAVTIKEGLITAIQSMQNSMAASAQPPPCLCAIKADCQSGQLCIGWWQQCLPTWGCGYLWSEWCYAMCEDW